MNNNVGRFYTVKGLAAKLNVTAITIYKLVERGKLPAVRIGRSIRFDPNVLDAFLGTSLDKE